MIRLTRQLQLDLHIYNEGIERAKAAYYNDPEPGMCIDCGTAPRYRASSYCNPCKHRRHVEKRWAS